MLFIMISRSSMRSVKAPFSSSRMRLLSEGDGPHHPANYYWQWLI